MVSTQTKPDYLQSIRSEKAKVRQQLHESHQRMSDIMHEIFAPVPQPASKIAGIGQLVSNGVAIYEGLKIGLSIISTLRAIFGKKKRK